MRRYQAGPWFENDLHHMIGVLISLGETCGAVSSNIVPVRKDRSLSAGFHYAEACFGLAAVNDASTKLGALLARAVCQISSTELVACARDTVFASALFDVKFVDVFLDRE